ncbi:ABC1 kinase family protein [Natranaerobius thermophilus]|uniref:ABC-1 domain protein n=1 Tax=Natranaerobius thermophilus (strain ATCC BAA-1301 / DSM 18059 / JW/NM-WN-LF) TaxID=457570 RepID=B2A4X1_NATTJ|nr:AarF/ABC1/UbiB kinase family protein [Natranaerobius thermophilus]ACB83893.1 ABC-1 domain protein [Natranaerobius thermophilus JW/NM-WN-LF]
MFKRRIRHFNRYREIVSILARHGFGFLIEELGLHHMLSLPSRIRKESSKQKPKPVGLRMRLAFQELGPTFIKFGQLLSTRPDMLPEHIINELDKLQDRVDPFPYEEAKENIEDEMETSLEELFAEFDEEPLAAASIGQVHSARLKNGDEVVIKVQRPNISSVIETDLEILADLISLAETRFSFVSQYNLKEIVDEFSISIRKELNYTLEARNAEKFKSIFSEDDSIYIPGIYWDLTSKRVITMERVKGTNLNNLEEVVAKGFKTSAVAKNLTESFLNQILIEGFFHGDPHPGNFILLDDGRLAFTDFGIVGQLTPELKDSFASLMISVVRQDVDDIVKNIMKVGFLPDEVNINRLKRDVMTVRDKYYHLPLKQISFSEAIEDFFDIAFRHKIQIPSELSLLGKTFLTLEGVVKNLDPDVSVVEIAEPFGSKILKEKLRPENVWQKFTDNIKDYGEMVLELPGELRDFVRILKKGKGTVELQMPQLDSLQKKLDRVSNKLSFSIVLLAFSIIMSGLIIGASLGGQSMVIWQVPAVEIGFLIAMFMFFWLLFSIFRSGRF